MIQKSITYTNFAGEEVTEDHFFHLTEADLAKMELSTKGGLAVHLQKVVETEDGAEIMRLLGEIIEVAYGKKSEDGKRFIKKTEDWEEFKSSEAYSELFMELCTDAEKSAEFVNGIVPREKLDARAERFKATQMPERTHPSDPAAQPQPLGTAAAGPRRLTRAEVTEMDSEELNHLLATGQAVIGQA